MYILIPVPDIDLLILLPEYFSVIKDFQELMSTEQIELENLWARITQVWLNQFIQTADVGTIEYHENLLGIVPDPGDTLEIRRWRVLLRYRLRLPFTLPKLYELLNGLVGIGEYYIDIDYPNYTMTVHFFNTEQTVLNEAIRQLVLVPPAHLAKFYINTVEQDSEATEYFGGTMSIGVMIDPPSANT